MSTLTQLIHQMGAGDRGAQDVLFAAAYPELRRLAHARLVDRGGDAGLQTTALVHESYLRFIQAGELRAEDRRAFFSFASKIMRSVIIDEVRSRQAQRRGGDAQQVTLDTGIAEAEHGGEQQILDLHEALTALEAAEPRLARIVEMRYFGGYTLAETADALDLTVRTVRRDWDKARLVLMNLISAP